MEGAEEEEEGEERREEEEEDIRIKYMNMFHKLS